MSQQINLFDARFRRQAPHFSSTTLVIALAAVLGFTIAIRELYAYQSRAMQATFEEIDRRAAELRDQTVRFAREFGDQGASIALADEIARVDGRLRARRALLEGIQGGPSSEAEGFSPYLTALARQTMHGVWLTGVEIGASGELVLKGRVLESELVPAYMRRLNQEPLFKGRPVRELRLAAKGDAGKRYVEFSLQIPLLKGSS